MIKRRGGDLSDLSVIEYTAGVGKDRIDKHRAHIINGNVIALGGITVDKISQVRDYGFGGVAILGSAWKDGIAQLDIIKQMME